MQKQKCKGYIVLGAAGIGLLFIMGYLAVSVIAPGIAETILSNLIEFIKSVMSALNPFQYLHP